MLNDLTRMDVEGLFSMNRRDSFTYEEGDDTWIMVTVEMDPNLMMYERSVYTFFDLLSDLGGLNGILMTFAGIFIAELNYNKFENKMVKRLFRIKKPE